MPRRSRTLVGVGVGTKGDRVDDAGELTSLVRQAADGDRAAWETLVDRYTNLLWSIARGYRLGTEAAADVVQTSWLRLLENLGRIKEPERLGAWLATTARHECLRVLRRTQREELAEDTSLDRPDAAAQPLDAALLLEERDAALWRALSRVGERCQQLLRVLMADPPPTYEAVSAALEMPVGSIGPTRARCLAKLREQASAAGLGSVT
jgi:RNA polymerase sigma factor (sigma-70 family)